MRIFFALILICSAVFANTVPDILFVSRNNEYLLAVKATLENPKVSYDTKGADLLVTITTPSVAGQDTSFINNCKQCNSDFAVSEIVTKISEGSIKILLKNSKLSLGDVRIKQTDNSNLFYWGNLTPEADKKTDVAVQSNNIVEILPQQNANIHEFTDTPQVPAKNVKAAEVIPPAVTDSVDDIKDTIVPPAPKKIFSYMRKGRDPFLPLDKSAFVREGLPHVNNITLVGILYDSKDGIALFEEEITTENNKKEIVSFSMKVGDPVVSGKLLKIEQNKVVFLMREATFSYTIEKELNVN